MTAKQKLNPDKECVEPDAPGCPFHSGKNSPYRYQLGCRGEACKSANREYYRKWRNDKLSANSKKKAVKKVPAKKKIVKRK